ncbi:hypothetical protein Ancab_011904 [Ancistrocladus abbreviatus]
MEDDEEIHSHPSPEGSESPSSPHHNDRVTVTVAAAGPTPSPPQNSLTLALPIPQPRTSGGGGVGGGREDCWSEGATSVLIDAWGERYLELSRGNLKQKHWKEVADIISSREDYTKAPRTDIQCKNRIDTVKKKYKIEKAKVSSGSGPSKWPFYDRLDRLIGPAAKAPCPAVSTATAEAASSQAAYNSGIQKVPVGIPVGVRSLRHFQLPQQTQQQFPSPRSLNQRINTGQNNSNPKDSKDQPVLFRRRPPVDSDSEPDGPSPDSTESFPPDAFDRRKRPRLEFKGAGIRTERGGDGIGGPSGSVGGAKEREKRWGNSVRELTRAILKFGEAYEQAESAKMVQLMEMEKQRMKFTKELEIQRMKFLMKTQLELSQMNRNSSSRSLGDGHNNHHHHHGNNDKSNNCDSSN